LVRSPSKMDGGRPLKAPFAAAAGAAIGAGGAGGTGGGAKKTGAGTTAAATIAGAWMITGGMFTGISLPWIVASSMVSVTGLRPVSGDNGWVPPRVAT